MRKLSLLTNIILFLGAIVLIPASCMAQSNASATLGSATESSSAIPGYFSPLFTPEFNRNAPLVPALTPAPPPPPPGGSVLSRVGMGVKVSTLGAGIEAAVRVAHRLNVRGGFNDFSYSRTLTNDGVTYDGNLVLRSGEAHLDYFLFRGFHISGGALLYNDNHANANASVPGGDTFTLNGTTYTSDPTNPITGAATLGLNKAAPTVTMGFGNLVGHHRFSVNFEVGAAFQGSPKIGLNFIGNECDANGLNCQNSTTDTTFQSNVQAQQKKISNDLSPFKYYPIVSLGFGWRF